MNKLIERQIRKVFGEACNISPKWWSLLQVISDTYDSFDQDRDLVGRSMDLSSQELMDANKRLRGIAQELTLARIELEKSIATKGEFMNIAAHELRTPLQPIMGYADRLLKKGNLTRWQKERILIILQNAKGLLRLIQDILDINKIETGIMKFSMEEVDIVNLVKGVYTSFKPSVEDKKLRFILDAPEIKSCVETDPQKLTQVFFNLIDNAVKFTDQGSITIKVEDGQDTVVVSIADTGIGIAEKDISHLFTKFFQTDSSLKRKQRGTGLGLAISREIIKTHGGKILVESVLGEGSTFRVKLPKSAQVNHV